MLESAVLEFKPTICICTRNRPEELANALASVSRSQYPASQLIVSDDGTDDRTRRLLASHPEADWGAGPRVGLGANRNAAIDRARGSHILFIDDDVELRPDFLGKVRDRLAGLPMDDRPRAIVAGTEQQNGRTIIPNEQSRLGHQARPYRAGEPLRTLVINGAVFPRELFRQVRFDAQLVYGYDEVDLTTRAVAAGYVIHPCFEAYNVHRPSPAGRAYYRPHVEASRIYVTRKRLAETDRAPWRARSFLVVASVHAVASAVRTQGPSGWRDARRTLGLANAYWSRHRRLAGPVD